MNEEDLLEMLRERTANRMKERDLSRINTEMSTGKKVGNMALGLFAGLGDGLAGTTGTATKVLEAYNRDNSKKLDALDDEDGLDSLISLYKVKQAGELQREMQNMREASSVKKEAAVQSRFEASQRGQDRRIGQRIGAQDKMLEKRIDDSERKDIVSGVDSSLNALLKQGFKFADAKATNVSNKRALEKMRTARNATSLKGPLFGAVGNAMAYFNAETPAFAQFNRLVKDTVSVLIKERSGVAASEPEMRRLEATLPKISQRNDTFEAVLQDVIKTADSIISDRKNEYEKVALDAVAKAIPGEGARAEAFEKIQQGQSPVDVLQGLKDTYRKGSGSGTSAAKASPTPKLYAKPGFVNITNGKEVLTIPKADLPSAVKDGFRELK